MLGGVAAWDLLSMSRFERALLWPRLDWWAWAAEQALSPHGASLAIAAAMVLVAWIAIVAVDSLRGR